MQVFALLTGSTLRQKLMLSHLESLQSAKKVLFTNWILSWRTACFELQENLGHTHTRQSVWHKWAKCECALSRAALPEEVKHLLIFTKDQHVVTLILRHIHQQLSHSARNNTLSTLRRKYWITRAPSAIRKVWMCRLLAVRAGEQKMADLSSKRIFDGKSKETISSSCKANPHYQLGCL